MNRSESPRLLPTVEQNLTNCIGKIADSKAVIGVSGGVDSMVLLYLVKQLGIKGYVAHVNYGTRGEDSDADQQLVEQVSYKYGFQVETLRPRQEGEETGNFQDWARQVRYQFLREVKKKYNADVILTAHHKDDQIETILHKVLRGAGPASWRGMAISEEDLCRPLLAVSKTEIKNFATAKNISYRTDCTNTVPEYARNFLRIEITRELDKHIPGWEKNILKLPERAREFREATEALIAFTRISDQSLNFKALLKLQKSVRRSVVLAFLKQKFPSISISRSALGRLDKLADLQTGQRIVLSSEVGFIRDRNALVLVSSDSGPSPTKIIITRSRLQEAGIINIGNFNIELDTFEDPDFDHFLYLDLNALQFPLTVRPWRSGDTIQPFGMEGTQKVSDHLTNRKISALDRNNVKVLETFDGTISAIIFPAKYNHVSQPGTIDHRFRCTKRNEVCLKIGRS